LFNKATKLIKGSNKAIEIIGNVCVWGMFFIVLLNTLIRMFTGNSFSWAEEISKLLMVWMAMLTTGLLLCEGGHVALTFLFEKLNKKAQVVALLIFDILTLVFSLLLMESGNLYAWDNINAVLPASNLPRDVLYLALGIGGLMMAFYSIYLIWKRVLQLKGSISYEEGDLEEETEKPQKKEKGGDPE